MIKSTWFLYLCFIYGLQPDKRLRIPKEITKLFQICLLTIATKAASYISYHLVRACVTRQFRVLIRLQNRPGQPDGRTDRQILYGRTGPDRRPLYNFDQRSLVSQSVSGQSLCDGGYQRLISLWFSNMFWKKTKYPPRTVWNPTVLWSFFTHPNWGLFFILLIFKYPDLNL
jgi:hypothetical protein